MSIHWGGRGAGHVSRWSASTSGVPSLVLDFLTTTSLDSRITFTRSTTATFIGSNGLIQSAAINAPRFDYDPVTLAPKGLLIEEQRINLLLNSLINGTSLSTQNVTVAATPYTISFYGTGTITLTGAAVATVTGTGVYPNRQTLTFTPIVGVLVCTVVGSVQYAQLEAGRFATSFIPTAGSATTRAVDVASMTSTNFSSWYNASEGTFVASFDTAKPPAVAGANFVFIASDGTQNERIQSVYDTSNIVAGVIDGNVTQANFTNAYTVNQTVKCALAYKVNNFAASFNGAAATTDTAGTIPTVNRMTLGSSWDGSNFFLSGHIRQLTYYKTRLLNTTLQTLTQ
jgi:hypothetical protein